METPPLYFSHGAATTVTGRKIIFNQTERTTFVEDNFFSLTFREMQRQFSEVNTQVSEMVSLFYILLTSWSSVGVGHILDLQY